MSTATACPHGFPVRPGTPYTLDQCRVCWLDAGGDVKRPVAGLPPPRVPAKPVGPKAVQLPAAGPEARVGYCSARGAWDWWAVRSGAVVAQGSEPAEAEAREEAIAVLAAGGPDRPPVTTRHLLYHLLPVTGRWESAASRLLARWRLFNGRKVVAVATGPPATRGAGGNADRAFALDDFAAVRRFMPADADLIEVPNDPDLREVATFGPLFSRVADVADPTAAVLYAHAKGVTQPREMPVHRWAAALHELYLDHWPVVDELLRLHPLAGAFLKVGQSWAESASAWHYSGSWFWFRPGELFAKPDWRRIDQFWSGIEPYPSLHFPVEEAGVIFGRGRSARNGVDLYDWAQWLRDIDPALAAWKTANAGRRAVP